MGEMILSPCMPLKSFYPRLIKIILLFSVSVKNKTLDFLGCRIDSSPIRFYCQTFSLQDIQAARCPAMGRIFFCWQQIIPPPALQVCDYLGSFHGDDDFFCIQKGGALFESCHYGLLSFFRLLRKHSSDRLF